MLVVDHDAAGAEAVARAVRAAVPACDVRTACSSDEAMKALAEGAARLVIAGNGDMLDGLGLLAEVERAFPGTQTLLVTSRPENVIERVGALQITLSLAMRHPVDDHTLGAAARDLLVGRPSRQHARPW